MTLLSHAGQLDAEAESAASQLTWELALPVELAIVVHSEGEGACKLEVLTELQGSLDMGERSMGFYVSRADSTLQSNISKFPAHPSI